MGLWQFMPGTGRLYGLHINSTIDDRMNIYKATEAACQHFSDLYARYHDWNLVLAAYNAGPEAVDKYNGVPPFSETQSYIQKVLKNYLNNS